MEKRRDVSMRICLINGNGQGGICRALLYRNHAHASKVGTLQDCGSDSRDWTFANHSDPGGDSNLESPPELMRMYVASLLQMKAEEGDIRKRIQENPAKILGWEDQSREDGD